MRRDLIESGIAKALDGYTVTVRGMSEDLDAGVASVANRGAVQLRIEAPSGFVLELELPGAEAEKIVRPLVAGAVEHETDADVARRYLRDHSEHMYPYQIESLKKQAGMKFDQAILDEAMKASEG
ncbi:hypothetical protein Achl_4069 (plasmid) [Pseudarthrobacter chlorophenolicus A6]|uniref:Uncharacterized protein n=1 Tax=Pseudarthrobacter chlorophenolicus (strain ATCC 700700 / DSM 12829 / CIP 107037 / JCM 12360 / KCTC 9906 / NCIMB 13794 / A6) TaxID=452863 RepID=B8HHX3_PSECP|nr:hypothetical protein [Pseudarthrobacter chlorophenolicus]ACL42020.1 hypothetical protein Achl_4069 [Pseudarthrobacter chlorophenolicus A6]SDQ20416.1 hypothetical protein SAMN04489738_0720 [Pseudarthrobacter chlorophenolicus]